MTTNTKKLDDSVFQELNENKSLLHQKNNVYMSFFVPDMGEWRVCYRKECAFNDMKPAIDIQHAYVLPEARRKGYMTIFIFSLDHWFAANKIPLTSIYMTKEMVDENEDFGKFWDSIHGERQWDGILKTDRVVGWNV